MGKTILFVYGTLRRGRPAHRLIADQRFLGEAETEPRYRVLDLGRYPGLVRDAAAGATVRGELWEVSACRLDELDRYEGAPELFVREPVAVRGFDGPVEAYFYNRPVQGPGAV